MKRDPDDWPEEPPEDACPYCGAFVFEEHKAYCPMSDPPFEDEGDAGEEEFD